MIKGEFIKGNVPIVKASIASGHTTQETYGEIVAVPTASAFSTMEGITKSVQVLISKSMPFMGISFLTKFDYKAIVDCKNKTVVLKRVLK